MPEHFEQPQFEPQLHMLELQLHLPEEQLHWLELQLQLLELQLHLLDDEQPDLRLKSVVIPS